IWRSRCSSLVSRSGSTACGCWSRSSQRWPSCTTSSYREKSSIWNENSVPNTRVTRLPCADGCRPSARQARTRSVKHARIIVTHYGGPDALRVLEEECPEPKDGEVRVRVLAAGVSLPDIMMREGIHPETPPLPFTPGWDLIGVVDRLGGGVSGIERGQIVAAL